MPGCFTLLGYSIAECREHSNLAARASIIPKQAKSWFKPSNPVKPFQITSKFNRPTLATTGCDNRMQGHCSIISLRVQPGELAHDEWRSQEEGTF